MELSKLLSGAQTISVVERVMPDGKMYKAEYRIDRNSGRLLRADFGGKLTPAEEKFYSEHSWLVAKSPFSRNGQELQTG